VKFILPNLLVLLATFSAWADPLTGLDVELKKQWPGNRTINIVFHGHSVPSGYHLTPTVKPFESYPHLFRVLLKQRYPNAVINVITTSIGGENSVGGAARFNADVLPQKPDLLFIDYALNDRSLTVAQAETAWRSMITNAKTAGIPVMLLTPTGASDADLSNPADSLTVRASLIRSLAQSENVLLGEVSGAWLAELAAGTSQSLLLSQGNHPNLAGHQIAANAILSSFLAATGDIRTLQATNMPRNATLKTYTTADSLLTLTTTNFFSGQGDFLGDSGGATAAEQNSWHSNETLQVTLNQGSQFVGFGLRWTVGDIVISGFDANPRAMMTAVASTAGSVIWDEATKRLTLRVPWDNGASRFVFFNQPGGSAGRTLNFAFTNSSPGWKASIISFSYLAGPSLPAIHSFTAQPTNSPAAGSKVTLAWNVQNAMFLTVDPGSTNGGPYTTNGLGQLDVFPVSTTTYVLTADGTSARQVVVNVPLRVTGIRINATNRVEVTASGLREGMQYQLFRAPDLQTTFAPTGVSVTGDATGIGTFLDPVTDARAVPAGYYQVRQN